MRCHCPPSCKGRGCASTILAMRLQRAVDCGRARVYRTYAVLATLARPSAFPTARIVALSNKVATSDRDDCVAALGQPDRALQPRASQQLGSDRQVANQLLGSADSLMTTPWVDKKAAILYAPVH